MSAVSTVPAPHAHRGHLVRLAPNRVWRTYQGGRTLDAIAGAPEPVDSHFPEDWIGSATRAVNVGRGDLVEGLSRVSAAGHTWTLRDLFAADPDYFFGSAHVATYGPDPRLLVKFLDPVIRLHFQVHPTVAFARQFLASPSGKTEAYHVLATRPEVAEPYIYLGFQRPPTRAALRRMIEQQDIAGLEACFDKIRVRPGDTYIVPGGVPHALGEGVFLIEVQEPTDLVVRFEFERGGYVLPESARFMNRGLEFCLDIFDLTPRPLATIDATQRCGPQRVRTLGARSQQAELIGLAQTPCFRVVQKTLNDAVTVTSETFSIVIVTEGALTVEAAGQTYSFKRYDAFLIPAGLGALHLTPTPHATLLECHPPV